ncbi:PHP domain-like protein [Piedraia hortae CBS 480.64]|uniref:PHP domain-like protein n=1 Tax=Piedraia hortae CBS 480.64 TaxID=1314780 RepID=A0A6A7C584_9PEZI|nr:PHP domain-like protein [Piedraia hortae CBS 480.64]
MFCDLNIPWSSTDANLPSTLAFLSELNYTVIALNHAISGKLPAKLTCAIPFPLPLQSLPPNLQIKRRVTLTLTETPTNAHLSNLSRHYDLLALRPIDEKTLQQACTSLDCDIISLDLTQRLPYFFSFKTLSVAIKRGKRFEICYSQALLGDSAARRNLINNVAQLARASRGRGLVISSEAKQAMGCRGPWDVVNLATVWGVKMAHEAVSSEAWRTVVGAQLKRTSYRGAVDVVYAGEKEETTRVKEGAVGAKRKAESLEEEKGEGEEGGEGESGKAISKREKKRRAKLARHARATVEEGKEV